MCHFCIKLKSLLLVKNMSETTIKELPATSNETTEEQSPVKKFLKKKQIQLLFPYAERQEAKTLGAKWDANLKMLCYPSVDGSIPEELSKYKVHDVFIEYEDKEYYKNVLTSMKFDKLRKVWMVNTKDFKTFLKL